MIVMRILSSSPAVQYVDIYVMVNAIIDGGTITQLIAGYYRLVLHS